MKVPYEGDGFFALNLVVLVFVVGFCARLSAFFVRHSHHEHACGWGRFRSSLDFFKD